VHGKGSIARSWVQRDKVVVHWRHQHNVGVEGVFAHDVHGLKGQDFLDVKQLFLQNLNAPVVCRNVVGVGADTVFVECNNYVEFHT